MTTQPNLPEILKLARRLAEVERDYDCMGLAEWQTKYNIKPPLGMLEIANQLLAVLPTHELQTQRMWQYRDGMKLICPTRRAWRCIGQDLQWVWDGQQMFLYVPKSKHPFLKSKATIEQMAPNFELFGVDLTVALDKFDKWQANQKSVIEDVKNDLIKKFK